MSPKSGLQKKGLLSQTIWESILLSALIYYLNTFRQGAIAKIPVDYFEEIMGIRSWV